MTIGRMTAGAVPDPRPTKKTPHLFFSADDRRDEEGQVGRKDDGLSPNSFGRQSSRRAQGTAVWHRSLERVCSEVGATTVGCRGRRRTGGSWGVEGFDEIT